MVDARILASKWVYVKPEGGTALKQGAPPDVVRQYEEYKSAIAAVHAAAREDEGLDKQENKRKDVAL